MTRRAAPQPPGEVGFEEALARLEDLVSALEGGKQTLEESLRTFEEGVRLVRICSERLQGAELRIRELEATPGGLLERPLVLEDDE